MMRLAHASRLRGFTLLEAIVALVLISGAGFALFGWINTSLISLNRVQEIATQADAAQNVLDYMHNINPMQRPEGTVDFGAYQLRWKSKAITVAQDGAGYPLGVSLYQLALFQTRLEIIRGDERWFDLDLRQVGHKKVRSIGLPF